MDEQNSNSKRKYYIGGLIVAIVFAVAFYFLYWVKTPAYSLGIIKTSIEKHDLAKFEQHVDLNTLYGRAYDSYMSNELKGNDNELVLGLVKAMRGVILDELTNRTKKYVETGKFETKKGQEGQETSNKDPFKIDGSKAIKDLGERTGAQGMEYKGIEKTEKDGKIAVVSLKLRDTQLNKEFILKIKMRELDNGEWQAVEVSNFTEFLKNHDQAVTDKIAEINKPIREKMDKLFKISDKISAKLSATNSFFRSDDLFYTIGIVLPDKEHKVKEVYGKFIIKDAEGQQVVVSPIHLVDLDKNYDKPDYSATKEYEITWKRASSLNPFMSQENKIMENGLQEYKFSFAFNKLVLMDGSVIELVTKLPQAKK